MFNIISLNRSRLIALKRNALKATLALFGLAMLTTLSCGKRKPPLPPLERVIQRVELSGFQRGNEVILEWKMPARNAGPGSVLNISRVDIYRFAEPFDAPLALSEEEFASRSLLIATVPIKVTDFGLKTISHRDKLEFAGQAARLRYAIRFVNASGQKAAFSSFLLVEPAARVAAAPQMLAGQITQTAIVLTWRPPLDNIDGSTPPNVLGFNVYRSSSKSESAKLLNDTPVTMNEFRDEFFDFGTEYSYFVRAVSSGTGGEPVESRESEIIGFLPKDIFPPSAPTAITVAAAPNSISLFFAIGPEKDIAGYSVYRSTDETNWNEISGGQLTTNTFQDTRIISGTKYFYYITATDTSGNVSDRSETVHETAP
ncbi:MAG: fibronectin type III domain-containing protein [Pyrinomonadaceae bacterium]